MSSESRLLRIRKIGGSGTVRIGPAPHAWLRPRFGLYFAGPLDLFLGASLALFFLRVEVFEPFGLIGRDLVDLPPYDVEPASRIDHAANKDEAPAGCSPRSSR